MGSLQVRLVGLPVDIDFQDEDLVRVGLVLHGEKADDAGLRGHGYCSDLLGKFQVFFQLFRIHFDPGQADDPLSVFPDRDISPEQAGDIVFVELPEIGAHLEVAAEAGTIESVKAVSPIYSPAAGNVVRTNAELESAPEKVNADPYESWFFVLEVSDPHAADSLLDAEAYRKICE